MLMFGDRESASPGHYCVRCRAPATHVRRNTLVGGGHRRLVYWCAEHDDPRTQAPVDDRGGPFPWSCVALDCPCVASVPTQAVVVSVTPEIDAALDAWGRCVLSGQGDGVALRLAANKVIATALVLGAIGEQEVRAVWAALSQYVENGECDDSSESEDPLLATARRLLERVDAVVASLAESPGQVVCR